MATFHYSGWVDSVKKTLMAWKAENIYYLTLQRKKFAEPFLFRKQKQKHNSPEILILQSLNIMEILDSKSL